MELWAGNERAHRHVNLPGLEGDVIALPSGSEAGGDLYALFSCGGENYARIVLADCVGHGYQASRVATHVHGLVHKFQDVRDPSRLLAALNDEFTLTGQAPGGPLRLTTVATATFDRTTGEFNYAYAAHPRMLLWREGDSCWVRLGDQLEGFPLGFIAGEEYSQQSVRLAPGDVVLVFSDAVTEVRSPAGEELEADGLFRLVEGTGRRLERPWSLHAFAEALLDAVTRYQDRPDFEDDLTLMGLRRL